MAEKTRLDLAVILPDVPDAADACVTRLVQRLVDREGVSEAHVVPASGETPAQLCIHYDPDRLSLFRIRKVASGAGAQIGARYGHAMFDIAAMHQRRARTLADRLKAMPGVLEADVAAGGRVQVEFDRERTDEATIRSAVADRDAPASQTSNDDHAGHDHGPGEHDHGKEGHNHSHGGILGPNTELFFALGCGAVLGVGFAIEKLVVGAPSWLPLACYLIAYVLGGFFTVREAIDNLRMRRFEIDTLMLVAAAGAAALGAWAEGALLLFLFSFGHALEHYAMGRAKRAIEALAELAPKTALVRREGRISEVSVDTLVMGDIVVVKPNARLPADGFLTLGSSSINQAPVTGEKTAVDDADQARADPDRVDAASRVFAGTINGSGAIEIEVTRLSTESALAKVVKMVSEAETQKSPTQRMTDRFERVFVPVVLGLAVLLLFAWVVIRQPLRAGDRNAERRVVGCRSRRARRCAGEGRRAAGEPRFADRHRFRQDRHAHGRPASDHRCCRYGGGSR